MMTAEASSFGKAAPDASVSTAERIRSFDAFADNIADGAAGGERVRALSISGLLKRAWIPLLLVVVLSVSALVVTRLHKVFASQDLNANSGAGIKIVQFNPK
ncbi:MAG: hypothetical protein QOD88_1193, partial [Mycobacterium sp.]|nr:hypothetical protein [Mycobacterium sp.]